MLVALRPGRNVSTIISRCGSHKLGDILTFLHATAAGPPLPGAQKNPRGLIPPGGRRRVPGMTTRRTLPIKSGVKAGFDPQPDPPKIANIGSLINVIRVISR